MWDVKVIFFSDWNVYNKLHQHHMYAIVLLVAFDPGIYHVRMHKSWIINDIERQNQSKWNSLFIVYIRAPKLMSEWNKSSSFLSCPFFLYWWGLKKNIVCLVIWPNLHKCPDTTCTIFRCLFSSDCDFHIIPVEKPVFEYDTTTFLEILYLCPHAKKKYSEIKKRILTYLT